MKEMQELVFRIAKLAYRYGEVGKPWAQWRSENEVATELDSLIEKEIKLWEQSSGSTKPYPPFEEWCRDLERRGLAQRMVI